MESGSLASEEYRSEAEVVEGCGVAEDLADVRRGECVSRWLDPGRRRRCKGLRALPVPESWWGLSPRREWGSRAPEWGEPEARIPELALLAPDADRGVEEHPHQQDQQQQ